MSGFTTCLYSRCDRSLFFRLRPAPVPKFLNPDPGPAILQIRESDSCSDSGYNHRSNRNLTMFSPKKERRDSCYCRNEKVTPDPGPLFHKFLTLEFEGSGSERKTKNPAESTPVTGPGPTSAL